MSGSELDILLKYFPRLSQGQKEQFEKLGNLYSYWNERINVISRKDIENLYLHHVLHSLAVVKFVRFDNGLNVLDIGTGGGFPGIPLAIYYPEINFQLIDGTLKKITVVKEVIAELGLTNATAMQKRSEEMKDKFDIITGRAVQDAGEFIRNAIPLLRKSRSRSSGIWYWSGTLPAKKTINNSKLKIYPINKTFDEPYFEGKYVIRTV